MLNPHENILVNMMTNKHDNFVVMHFYNWIVSKNKKALFETFLQF